MVYGTGNINGNAKTLGPEDRIASKVIFED